MKVVVTTGAIRGAKIRSHCQQSNTQLFTDQMPFLSPNQQCQSTEGKTIVTLWMIKLTVSVWCWFVGGSSLTGALHGLYIAPAVTNACIGLSYSEVENGDILYGLIWVDLENSHKTSTVVVIITATTFCRTTRLVLWRSAEICTQHTHTHTLSLSLSLCILSAIFLCCRYQNVSTMDVMVTVATLQSNR